MSGKKYYAYYFELSNISGIVESWAECELIVKGEKVRYKGFKSYLAAKEWLDSGAQYESRINITSEKSFNVKKSLEKGLYFDAGTGRGIGTEVRVVNEKGENQLSKVVPIDKINEFGNYCIKDKTNNFGELLGCYIALKIVTKEWYSKIYGDSKLVLNYWSKGLYNKENIQDIETLQLIEKVKKLRREYEERGGEILYISGNDNPADLGFHR